MSNCRADHVGSLLRPPRLLEARDAHLGGRLELVQLRKIEDEAILTALDLQRQVGLDVFTDGEYRRGDFRTDFVESVEGLAEVNSTLLWRGLPSNMIQPAAAWAVRGKLRQRRRLTAHEVSFLKEHASGPFKITIPSASLMGSRSYLSGVTVIAYPTLFELMQDIASIYRRELMALVDEGVPYIQIDAPNYTSYVDGRRRQELRDAGGDPDVEFDEIIAADNACLERVKRDGVTVAAHLCRGNNRSAWTWEGAYEPIAEKVFGTLRVDRFLLEYDGDRCGGFEPLRFVPKGKTVVLGLVTTKEGRLESQDYLLRRIEEASRYVSLDYLAISPQCGFASVAAGNLLSWDDQRRKLELVVDTARRVWG